MPSERSLYLRHRWRSGRRGEAFRFSNLIKAERYKREKKIEESEPASISKLRAESPLSRFETELRMRVRVVPVSFHPLPLSEVFKLPS